MLSSPETQASDIGQPESRHAPCGPSDQGVGGRPSLGEAGITADDFQLYTAHAAPFCDCRRPPACANDAGQAAPALDDALSTAICTACTGDMDAHGWVVTAS